MEFWFGKQINVEVRKISAYGYSHALRVSNHIVLHLEDFLFILNTISCSSFTLFFLNCTAQTPIATAKSEQIHYYNKLLNRMSFKILYEYFCLSHQRLCLHYLSASRTQR